MRYSAFFSPRGQGAPYIEIISKRINRNARRNTKSYKTQRLIR